MRHVPYKSDTSEFVDKNELFWAKNHISNRGAMVIQSTPIISNDMCTVASQYSPGKFRLLEKITQFICVVSTFVDDLLLPVVGGKLCRLLLWCRSIEASRFRNQEGFGIMTSEIAHHIGDLKYIVVELHEHGAFLHRLIGLKKNRSDGTVVNIVSTSFLLSSAIAMTRLSHAHRTVH